MKKIIWCPLFLLLFIHGSYAQSLYDLVKGEEPAPITMRGPEETATPASPRVIPSIQFGGGMDFTSKQGTSSTVNFELGFLNKSILNIRCVSFGMQVELKINSQSTSWKVGGFSRIDLPVIIKNLFNPFVKLVLSYQDPSLGRPKSLVLAPSLGGQFVLGDNKRKYAAVDIALAYQLSNNKIFYDKAIAVNHAFQLSTGLKVYF